MDNQPAPKSKKIWWVLGGVAFVAIVAAASGNSNTPTPGAVAPSAQTANVAQQVVQPVAQPQIQQQQDTLPNNNTYVNSDGNTIHSPAYSNSGVPAGASAQCRDGTYSFSQHRSGTCSHHGGVMQWLQ
jgi:Rieske Fe-S protein